MPDPLPALEQAEVLQKKVHKLGEIEIENQKLKDTINTYKKDFADMKNNESKVQKLEKQLNEAKESNQENANKVCHFSWTGQSEEPSMKPFYRFLKNGKRNFCNYLKRKKRK